MTASILDGTSPNFLPTNVRGAASGGFTAPTVFPTSYQTAHTQYLNLLSSWYNANNFPIFNGTLYPEEAMYLHWLIFDIQVTRYNSYPATDEPTGATAGSASNTGIAKTPYELGITTSSGSTTHKITISDIAAAMRACQRPWHPLILRETTARLMLKNL